MNERFKFRAFINGRMVEVLNFGGRDQSVGVEVKTKGNKKISEKLIVNLGRYPIMQFTGLKDKNGVDTYVGDIVEWKIKSINYDSYDTVNCEVFQSVQGAYRLRGKNIYETELYANRKSVSVVGNIFSNPELLEETK